MARDYSRTERVGDFLRAELASLIQQEIRDPRVGMVSVTAVDVSRDLGHAKVFVTEVGKGSEEEMGGTLEALNHAAGFLRSQLAGNSRMRTTPRLRFYYDSSVLRGSHLTELIESVQPGDDGEQD